MRRHKLPDYNGVINEYDDGTVGYVPFGSFIKEVFRVRISDVTGFSETKSHKMLKWNLNIMGQGTILGTAVVNRGTTAVVESWFRSHPSFGSHGPAVAAGSVADELGKLGSLRAQGVLSEAEFSAAKARLLG